MEHGVSGQVPALAGDLLPVRVVRRTEIARDAVALWLATPGSERAPAPYLPGQFITVGVPAEGGILRRSYSLSGDGSADQPWEITVKRQRGGRVSSFLYDNAEPGLRLYASVPRGTFTLPRPLPPNMPLVFVAAGSGIAPIYGMLRWVATLPQERRPRVQLHYASDSPADILYGRELETLDAGSWWLHTWHYLASRGQRLTPEVVLEHTGPLTTTAHWYICGPEAFKRAFEAVALRRGVPAQRIHVESFGDPAAHEAARSGAMTSPARVRLASGGEVLHVRPGETLLEALERYGQAPPWLCRAGSCGECRVQVVVGRVTQPAGIALSAAERSAGYALCCVARPLGDVTLSSATAAPVRSPQRAKVALRAGLVAASLALFAGSLGIIAGQGVTAPDSGTTDGGAVSTANTSQPIPPAQPTTGAAIRSHIATQPPLGFPSTSTGVS
jgi:ferredoxin-NADP reductase